LNAAESIDWQKIDQVLRKNLTVDGANKLFQQLLTIVPPTCVFEGGQLKPRMSKYVPYPPHPKQAEFLMLDTMDAFYGGAAGGGKSVALLAGALQFADVPGYAALLLRKSFSELNLPKALMSMARDWLSGTGAKWKDHEKTWYLPTSGVPATLTFGFLETMNDKWRYQSAAFQYIGLDEMTEFQENDATFLFSRLRREVSMPVPLRFRGASNPTGAGRLWVKQRYVDPVTRGDRVFVPAALADNPSLSREDYIKGMLHISDPIERAQVLAGDWEAQATGKFRRQWFKPLRAMPLGPTRYIRYWDLAATEAVPGKDPSFTAGVLVGTIGGQYYIADIVRDRLTPKGVEDLILQTAAVDGSGVQIVMEQEPGNSGVSQIAYYTRLLAGYSFKGDKVTGPREIRANGLASQAEAGNVFIVAAPWNKAFLDEIEVFPGGGHDDMVTACSGAFNELTGVAPVVRGSIQLIGKERLQPDW
jgi:predicted phage terminase large subunit-like protein